MKFMRVVEDEREMVSFHSKYLLHTDDTLLSHH